MLNTKVREEECILTDIYGNLSAFLSTGKTSAGLLWRCSSRGCGPVGKSLKRSIEHN